MVTNDKGFIPLKHRVIEGLARIAWNGEVTEEAKEGLIRELSPGPKAAFRCCVYKEREILRWRIRLACNEDASPKRKSSKQARWKSAK